MQISKVSDKSIENYQLKIFLYFPTKRRNTSHCQFTEIYRTKKQCKFWTSWPGAAGAEPTGLEEADEIEETEVLEVPVTIPEEENPWENWEGWCCWRYDSHLIPSSMSSMIMQLGGGLGRV